MIMDEKRSRASKRKSMSTEEGYWDCSVCTYRNSPEAFKCEICDVRKGTSTRSGRKPRINPEVVMQQVGQQVFTPPLKKEKKDGVLKKPDGTVRKDGELTPKDASTSKEKTGGGGGSNKKNRAPRLKNIDRSSGRSMEVTVGSVTVIITDYQPKKPSDPTKLPPSSSSAASLSPSSTASMTDAASPPKPSTEENTPTKTETVVVNGEAATRDES